MTELLCLWAVRHPPSPDMQSELKRWGYRYIIYPSVTKYADRYWQSAQHYHADLVVAVMPKTQLAQLAHICDPIPVIKPVMIMIGGYLNWTGTWEQVIRMELVTRDFTFNEWSELR